MVVWGRKTGWGPADRSAGVLWIRTGALYLGRSDPVQLYWDIVEGCHVRLAMTVYVSCVSDFSYRICIN
jgi:hypothetical protein